MRRIRIALLICDTPVPGVVDAHGDYLKIYTNFLKNSLPEHQKALVNVVVDGFEVRELGFPTRESFNPGGYEAVVLTGSAASAYEPKEWIQQTTEYVAWLISHKPSVKIIGICFGHQIVSQALGLECVPNGGVWEVGITPISLSEYGRKLFGVETLHIEQMHRDHVPIPEKSSVPIRLLGSTAPCANQGFVLTYPTSSPFHSAHTHKNIHVFTLQGHPEFNPDIVGRIVEVRQQSGAMSTEVVDGWKAAEQDRVRREIGDEGRSVAGAAVWKILGLN